MIDFAFLKQRAGDPAPDAGLAYFCMGLNAMVYLDPATWTARLEAIVSGMTVNYSPPAVNFHPAIAVLRGTGWALVVIQGTQGWQGWAEYVTGAGSTPWPLRPGRVFTPFFTLANEAADRLAALLPSSPAVLYTGHSLGAATAPLIAELLQAQLPASFTQFWYAQPRIGDLTYAADYPLSGYQLNIPIDPVPYLPVDVIADLADNPMDIQGTGQYVGIGYPRPLTNSVAPYTWPINGNFLASLAASIPDLRQSPHQTYWYNRVLLNFLDLANKAYYADYTQLLTDLGLLDPWPA